MICEKCQNTIGIQTSSIYLNCNHSYHYKCFFEEEEKININFCPKCDNKLIYKNEKICSICLENILYKNDIIKTKCNHIFHTKCIEKWLSKQNTCPICRDKINNISLKRLTFI